MFCCFRDAVSNPSVTFNGTSLPQDIVAPDGFSFLVSTAMTRDIENEATSAVVFQPISVGNVNNPTSISFQYQNPFASGMIKVGGK